FTYPPPTAVYPYAFVGSLTFAKETAPTLHKKYTQHHIVPDFVKPLFLLQITYPEIFHKKFTAP
ncbi:hypothetical protein ACI1VM_25625, partial [Escherichia coli]